MEYAPFPQWRRNGHAPPPAARPAARTAAARTPHARLASAPRGHGWAVWSIEATTSHTLTGTVTFTKGGTHLPVTATLKFTSCPNP